MADVARVSIVVAVSGCDSGRVTDPSAAPSASDSAADEAPDRASDWLTMPDLVTGLGEPLARVRRLLDDRHLVGSKRTGVFAVPAVFVMDGEPLASLRGTLFVLHDAGFSDDEAIDWLLAEEESIGLAPIEALRRGRKSEVRRVAQTLA